MRIAVFGAAGMVGRRTTEEALARGHEVVAVVRDPSRPIPTGADRAVADADDPGAVEAAATGADLAVVAVKPAPGREHEQAGTTKSLFDGLAPTGVRVVVVGGAATLRVPDTGGLAIDDPRYVQAPWRAVAQASADQHEVCRGETRSDWVYVSPPAILEPGERSGRYRIGGDDLLVDERGDSRISAEDLAVAIIDEAETPGHHRTRFTVAAA